MNGVSWLWSVPGIHDDGIDYFTPDMIVGDICHSLDLGQVQRFAGCSPRRIVDSNVFSSQHTRKS
jgi:hypothetical protein